MRGRNVGLPSSTRYNSIELIDGKNDLQGIENIWVLLKSNWRKEISSNRKFDRFHDLTCHFMVRKACTDVLTFCASLDSRMDLANFSSRLEVESRKLSFVLRKPLHSPHIDHTSSDLLQERNHPPPALRRRLQQQRKYESTKSSSDNLAQSFESSFRGGRAKKWHSLELTRLSCSWGLTWVCSWLSSTENS